VGGGTRSRRGYCFHNNAVFLNVSYRHRIPGVEEVALGDDVHGYTVELRDAPRTKGIHNGTPLADSKRRIQARTGIRP
jgi:hypothetical protein